MRHHHRDGGTGVRRSAPATALVVVGAALLAGCTGTSQAAAPEPTITSRTTDQEVLDVPSEPGPDPRYELCAEFPATTTGPRDLEGWWSSTPANPDGSVIHDPADWVEPRMREHPRVAVLDVATAAVISTWDRRTCAADPAYVPTRTDAWPSPDDANRVVVDMDSGEVLGSVMAY